MLDSGTGRLNLIGSTAAGTAPYAVAADPLGRFVYAGNFGSADLSIYVIDPATGVLGPIGRVETGEGAYSLAVHPNGAYFYAANENSGTDVWVYRIGPEGGLPEKIQTVAAGISPISMTLTSAGDFAFVANNSSDDLSVYRVNEENGALILLGTAAAGESPRSLTIDPTDRFVYVAVARTIRLAPVSEGG